MVNQELHNLGMNNSREAEEDIGESTTRRGTTFTNNDASTNGNPINQGGGQGTQDTNPNDTGTEVTGN